MAGPWTKALAATLLVAVITWVSVCVDVIAHPEVDATQPVDAAYVLGPAEVRIEEALSIMDTGVAPVLLATISVDHETGEHFTTGHCGTTADDYRVECVLPDPYSTRGEARTLAAEVDEHGWSRVAVLTSTPHAGRARMLMERCTDAQVLVWTTAEGPTRMRDWARAAAYQSAAWAKAQLLREC